MQPAVIARIKIDNFLLGLPHMPEVYHPPEEGKSMGGLIDTSFYGMNVVDSDNCSIGPSFRKRWI